MDRELYQLAKEILISTLEQPSDRREAYLRRVCGDRTDLLTEVRSLLSQQEAPSPLVTGGALRVTRSLPAKIGPYEVVEILGEGGMGVVYHGRQLVPIKRDVAIKVLHAGLNTARILERFSMERRSLARMNHPNIARILDAGADDDGHPYVVLELVDGTPVTTWCQEHKGSITQKLDLMIKVCQAVQHAHDRGVLHRDLKPGNVLVRNIDGAPVPSVIDFGVAKALDESAAEVENIELTLEGQQIGTPAYMSPEQLAGSSDLDVRTDVYALGVILYELLAGQRPFDDEHLRQSQRRDAPSAPSTVSGRRELRGELDHICLMAIRPEPARRYRSATELAADLGRYTAGKPVRAAPDGWRYRTGKTIRRHPVLATLSLALMVFALVGVGFLAYHARRLNAERNRAVAAEKLARQEANAAGEIAGFMEGLFDEIDPISEGTAPTTALELLDDGAERLTNELQDQPANRARLWAVIGRVNQNIARHELAEQQLRHSLAAYAEMSADTNATLAARSEIFRMLAIALHDQGDYAASETTFRHALDAYVRAFPTLDVTRVQIKTDLATAIQAQGHLRDAQTMLDEAIAMAEDLGEAGAGEAAYTRNIRGYILFKRGAYAEALKDMKAALAINRRLYPGDTLELIASLNNVGGMSMELGQYAMAESLLVEARDMALRIYQGEPHPVVFRAESHLAHLALLTGDTAAAVQGSARCYAQALDQLGPDNPLTWSMLTRLAEARQAEGRLATADTLYRQALDKWQGQLGPHNAKTLLCRRKYGELLLARGDLAAAQEQLAATVAGFQAEFEPEHPQWCKARLDLAEVLWRQGDSNQARRLLQDTVPILERVYGNDYEDCRRARRLLREMG